MVVRVVDGPHVDFDPTSAWGDGDGVTARTRVPASYAATAAAAVVRAGLNVGAQAPDSGGAQASFLSG